MPTAPPLTRLRDLTLDPTTMPSMGDREIWGETPWPAWVKGLREPQWEAICGAWEAYQQGARYVFIDAPTGTGKTLIGECVRRLINPPRALYVCSTKTLQDQFAEDFSAYARVLKGRSNYPTADHPDKFGLPFWERLTAEDCLHRREFLPVPGCAGCLRMDIQPVLDSAGVEQEVDHCHYCHPASRSPYRLAKQAVIAAKLGVINTAYLLAEGNAPGDPMRKVSKASFIIADECDTLESVLMGYASVKIGKRLRSQLGIKMPRLKTKEEAWAQWCQEEALPKVQAELAKYPAEPTDAKMAKHVMNLSGIASGLANLGRGLAEGETGNWVYTGYERQDKNDHDIEFKPVRVDALAPQALWRHGGRWLLMSATLIDPHEQVSSLGIPDGEWEIVSVKGGFPKKRRPVVVLPVATMSRKSMLADPAIVPKMAAMVAKIAKAHPDDRILVHTVSYDMTNKMLDMVSKLCQGRPMLSYTSSSEREPTLERFKRTERAVVFAPSFDRGVDLPGDLCRVQVIMKMPFASLGDKQVARRMYSKDGQLWYSVSTVRTLVQMTGRAMRSADDWCTTYVLDKQFVDNVWKKNKRLLPKWWSEALRWDGQIAPPVDN